MVIDAYLRATIIYPFSCNNLKDRRAITSVVMPEFFWILSANFSDATQPWSNSLLDHVTRNNSTFHVEHISCAYFFFLFFPSNVILARSYFFFFYSARNNCFPKWINHRSNHTCAHVYNYSTVLFWTISQLYYLQKIVRFQNSTIFFFFLITVPPLSANLKISWRDPDIFIINFAINIRVYDSTLLNIIKYFYHEM